MLFEDPDRKPREIIYTINKDISVKYITSFDKYHNRWNAIVNSQEYELAKLSKNNLKLVSQAVEDYISSNSKKLKNKDHVLFQLRDSLKILRDYHKVVLDNNSTNNDNDVYDIEADKSTKGIYTVYKSLNNYYDILLFKYVNDKWYVEKDDKWVDINNISFKESLKIYNTIINNVHNFEKLESKDKLLEIAKYISKTFN